jgi:dTDP-glucose 4,6-dehydratase
VSDLIEGIFRLSRSDFYEPVNIGNPAELTVKAFAEKIIEMTGARSRIVQKPLPVDDPKQRRPDISRAGEVLGWAPKVDLEEGMRGTIDWFRGRL